MGAAAGAAAVVGLGAVGALIAYAAGVRVQWPKSAQQEAAEVRARAQQAAGVTPEMLEGGGDPTAARWAGYAGGVAPKDVRVSATGYTAARFMAASGVPGGAETTANYEPPGTQPNPTPGLTPRVNAAQTGTAQRGTSSPRGLASGATASRYM